MNELERIDQREQWQQQFVEAALKSHRAWCEDPNNLPDIIRNPWMAETPIVRIDVPSQLSKPQRILEEIKRRRAQSSNNSLTP